MSKKIFVGSLSWNTSEEELRRIFERFGEIVEAKLITDRETGRSRGFAFVTYVNDADADKAIAEMDGTEVDGRAIRVNEARERNRGPERGDRNGGGDRPRGRGGRGGGGRGQGRW
jgi:cold-inducible RNA-binding protein